VSGPGGAGKGALVERLVASDPRLWLSRSWTTRPPRPGEAPDAYRFVSRAEFEEAVRQGRFLEWAEFLGHLYGTPLADPPPGKDVVLEIDVQGAAQVKARHPDAVVVLLVPPSEQEQERRLRARGEGEAEVRARVEQGRREVEAGRALASAVVVNDDLDRAVAEVAGIIAAHRGVQGAGAAVPPSEEP